MKERLTLRETIAYLIALLTLVWPLAGCGQQSPPYGGGTQRVAGQIRDWQAGYVLEAFLVAGERRRGYGRVNVDNRGGFSYQLPLPNPGDLVGVSEFIRGFVGLSPSPECQLRNMPRISPSNGQAAQLLLAVTPAPGQPRFAIFAADRQADGLGVYVYFSQATQVQGLFEVACGFGPTSRVQYNINAPANWSYVVIRGEILGEGGNGEVVSRAAPGGDLQWLIFPFPIEE